MNTPTPSDHPYDFPPISSATQTALTNSHARAYHDYYEWKTDFLDWLIEAGKDPVKLDGYSEVVVRQTSYKIDRVMRWLWDTDGYRIIFDTDEADAFIKHTARNENDSDSNLTNYIKAIKRYFKFRRYERDADTEWDPELSISNSRVTKRDYFRDHEFPQLYNAALGYGTVKHYHSCSPEERDAMKKHLAQRFEKPKGEVTKTDFQRANSFKIPSLISVSLDIGLRPIEVERSHLGWVNIEDQSVVIPAREATKNDEPWECTLSSKSARVLSTWLDERATMEKYDDTDAIWLNRQGNPYRSSSLNPLLSKIVEESDIDPMGRDLSWYSIRHGVATAWVHQDGVEYAQEQLRHIEPKTTLGYASSEHDERKTRADNKRG